QSATSGVVVDLQAGNASGDVSVGTDSFSGINAVVGSSHDDTLSGRNAANTADFFVGGAGNDTIDGRNGYDLAIYGPGIYDGIVTDLNTVTGGITVNLASGSVVGDSSIGSDTLKSIEAVRGTNFNDAFTAVGFSGGSTNAGSFGTYNEFEGLGGNDTITGNGNTTLVFGSSGASVTVDLGNGVAD